MGPEGELEGPIDYFMWYVAIPGSVLVLGGAITLESQYTAAARIVAAVSAIVLAGVLYPLRTKALIRRRGLWRP